MHYSSVMKVTIPSSSSTFRNPILKILTHLKNIQMEKSQAKLNNKIYLLKRQSCCRTLAVIARTNNLWKVPSNARVFIIMRERRQFVNYPESFNHWGRWIRTVSLSWQKCTIIKQMSSIKYLVNTFQSEFDLKHSL